MWHRDGDHHFSGELLFINRPVKYKEDEKGNIKVIIISFFLALFFINRKCKKNKEERLRQNRIADRPLKNTYLTFPVNNQRNT